MSTVEIVLTRMMQDPAFAEALFSNAEQALAEYGLSAEEASKFKGLSRAQFDALATNSPEERKSLAGQLSAGDLAHWRTNFGTGG